MSQDPLADALPPQSLEAEQAVLGAILLDAEAVGMVTPWLKPEAFYRTAHQKLFALLVELYGSHGTVDPVLVADEMDRRGLTEIVGGKAVLADLMGAVASSAHAEHYGRIVREKAVLRGLIQAGRRIAQDAHGGEPCEDVLERAQKQIFDLAQQQEERQGSHIKDALREVFLQLEGRGETRNVAVSTGFQDLDEYTSGGLRPGELVIVAARPSIGKTSLALNLAHNVAFQESRPGVVIFSMEQAAAQVAEILACGHARVRRDLVRKGMLTGEQRVGLRQAADLLSEVDMYIDDSPGLTLGELRTKARTLATRTKNLGLIVLDYIQLMDSPLRRTEGRQQEISDISRGLKAIARELNVPVVALSQLNRLVESREGHKPRLSDLRESGSLEQDADMVLLLSRKDYYDREQDQGVLVLDIAKQRNGPVGELKLAFIKDYQRFENYSRLESSDVPYSPSGASSP